MTGSSIQADNARIARRQSMVAILVVLITLTVAFPAFAAPPASYQDLSAHSQDADFPERNSDPAIRVHDPDDFLSETQEEQLNADLERLRLTGTESVIFVRDGSDPATASESFAADLRARWAVESAPGADDGIVFVLTVDPGQDTVARIDYSAGANTLPKGTVTAEELDGILAVDQGTPATLNGYVDGLSFAAHRLTNTIYDQAGILTERQATTLHGDLQRLNALGVPTVVYIRSAFDESDQASADDMRVNWGVESSPGADDGLLFLLTIDPQDPEASTFEVSSGENTYPIRQLDAQRMDQIIADDVLPNVHNGDVYLGLAFAIRRTINLAEYSPPSPPALTSNQESFQTPLNIAAALLVQVTVIGYLLAPVVRERRITLLPGHRSLVEYGVIIALLAVLVGAAGILARNPASTLAGLGVFVWASCGIPVLHQIVSRRSHPAASATATMTTPPRGGHDVAPAN